MSNEINDLLESAGESFEKRPGCWFIGLGLVALFLASLALGLYLSVTCF